MISMTGRLSVICVFSLAAFGQSEKLGVFTNTGDVGAPAIKGNAEFNSSTGEYRITGSGSNMWAKQDQFQYAWEEMSGNFSVTATLRFLGQGADHRKAGIMVRQAQDTDAAYADVVIHGNGMPALQWRSRKGEDTNTFDLPFDAPGKFRIKLVRNGVRVYMYLGKDGETPKEIAHTEVSLRDPVLVGLAVCSHQADAKDTAVFSDVQIEPLPAAAPARKAQ